MRVLLVQGDAGIARSIEQVLSCENFESETTNSDDEALSLLHQRQFDIALLDTEQLSRLSGLEMLQAARKARIITPIMIVTRDSLTQSKIIALNSGADDYIVVPFHREELVVRIQAIVRRSRNSSRSTIIIENLAIDLIGKRAFVNGNLLHLTLSEYTMLELLARRKGTAMSQERLYKHMYGVTDKPSIKIIDVFICKIRKKIRRLNGGQGLIETRWGNGYIIV